MRVAAIYDIHGNLPALEAVLQDIRQAEVDHVVVRGDVILGPMPRETLTCLLDSIFQYSLSKAIATARCLRRWQARIQAPSRNSFERSCAGSRSSFTLNTSGF